MNRLIQRIGKGLCHGDQRQVALKVSVNIGLEQGQGHRFTVHFCFDATAQIAGNDSERGGPGEPKQASDQKKCSVLHGFFLYQSKFHKTGFRVSTGEGGALHPAPATRRYRKFPPHPPAVPKG